MPHHHHEYLCLDAVIDRCLKAGMDDATIANTANLVFGCNTPIEYVVQRRVAVGSYQAQLSQLLASPQMVQRSPEWYAARKTLITASDFAQALGEGKFATQKQFFQKKCGYEEEASLDMSLPPLKWGVMFEPVAAHLYEQRTGMRLHEFGLIRHPSRPYFGASPDGISEMGIMVEIKCPYRRKINYEVPTQYYYQIQGQMDVCGLEECDYLECEFSEVKDKQDWLDFQGDKGIILESSDDGGFDYMYDGSDINDLQTEKRVVHYWVLVKYNCMRVYKNPSFVDDKLNELSLIWDRVRQYQDNKPLYDSEVASGRKDKDSKVFVNQKVTGYSFI